MISIPADQQTTHESVPDEARVGRFSRGLESRPDTDDKLHRGKFSEGLERMAGTEGNRHRGRFSDGLEQLPATPTKVHRGTFAEGQAPSADLADEAGAETTASPTAAAERADLCA